MASSPSLDELYLDSLLIPQLVDSIVKRLLADRPTSPAGVTQCIKNQITGLEGDYCKAVVSRFQQLVTDIPAGPFVPGDRQIIRPREKQYGQLTFSIPQCDGSVVELFPGGSGVVVTPALQDHFSRMHSWNKSTAPSLGPQAGVPPRLWPLDQRLHLSSDYTYILKAIGLIGSSPIYEITASDWDAHNLTFCVPFGGVLHDTRLKGSTEPVRRDCLQDFFYEATVKLSQLRNSNGQKILKPAPPPPRQINKDTSSFLASVLKTEAFPRILDALALVNTDSGDEITSEKFFEFGLCFCVPVHGKQLEIVDGGTTKSVGLREIPDFVRMAREKLGLKTGEGRDQATSLYEELERIRVPCTNGALLPSSFLFSTGPAASESPVRRALGQVTDSDMLLFHRIFRQTIGYLVHGQFSAEDIDNLELCFVAYSEKARVPLLENGDRIRVTASNLSDFIRLAQAALTIGSHPLSPENCDVSNLSNTDVQKKAIPKRATPLGSPLTSESSFWELINLLEEGNVPVDFDRLDYRFVLRFPNDRTLLLKENGGACAVTRANLEEFVSLVKSKRELIHLAFVHSCGAGSTSSVTLPSPEVHQANFDPSMWNCSHSASWNTFELGVSSLLSPVFSMVQGLAGLNTVFSDEDMDRMHLTYCIPLPSGGKYDLVPNGRNISVTKELRNDFVQRVMFEKRRIEAKRQQRRAEAARGSPNMSRSISTIPLTAKQVQILIQLKAKLEALQAMTSVTEEQWGQLGLAYCLWCEDAVFDIIPEGRKISVKYANRQNYLHMAIAKVQEILQDQEERRNVVVPAVLREQGDLYSPAHFSSNLFSPLQFVTTRPVPQAQLINGTRLASPLSTSQTAAAQTTLAEFLNRHGLGALLHQLESSGVTSLSELCELHESDVQFISNVVSRRRLIEAAKLKK